MNQNMLNAQNHGDHYGYTPGEKQPSTLGSAPAHGSDMGPVALENPSDTPTSNQPVKTIGDRVPFDPYGAKTVKTESEEGSSYNEHNVYGKNKGQKKEFNEQERKEAMDMTSVNVNSVLIMAALIVVLIIVIGLITIVI